eukprot:3646467-Pleurochrysis_carterae.AAC.1
MWGIGIGKERSKEKGRGWGSAGCVRGVGVCEGSGRSGALDRARRCVGVSVRNCECESASEGQRESVSAGTL